MTKKGNLNYTQWVIIVIYPLPVIIQNTSSARSIGILYKKQNKNLSRIVFNDNFLILDPILFTSPREKFTRINKNYHQKLIIPIELCESRVGRAVITFYLILPPAGFI